MNVLVYNLAAEYAGAMTILENFYKEVLSYSNKSIHWYFLVTTDKLKDAENVTIIREPWVKKSWFHRWYYDTFKVQKVVKEKNIDVVYSMQNAPVRRTKAKQVVYLHQSLQFSPVKFSLLNKEQRGYAIRQKFVCNIYKRHLKHADHIIVQTEWFKKASAKWIPFDEEKISVVSPEVKIEERFLKKEYNLSYPLFFYPAGDGMHKNHELIIDACKILKEQGISDYKVIFTLDRKTALYSERIARIIEEENLPIEYTGIIPKEEVFDYYSKSIMLFPSYLETFGLPVLEAKNMKAIVFASDMPFCHEILDGYENAYFYKIDDKEKLASYMKGVILGELKYVPPQEKPVEKEKKTVIECIFDNVKRVKR